MEVQAITKSVRISPRKIRLVANSVKKLSVDEAITALTITPKRGGNVLLTTLKSALSNAVNNLKLDKNALVIESIEITEGQALKRFRPSTRGRVHPYKKRGSNVRIVLKEKGKETNNGAKN